MNIIEQIFAPIVACLFLIIFLIGKGLYKMMNKTLTDNSNKPIEEKIKVSDIHIIVTGTKEKPYFEILYHDISDNDWHIGFSSYDLNLVFKWKEECFKLIEDFIEVNNLVDVITDKSNISNLSDYSVVHCKNCKLRGKEDCPMSYYLELEGAWVDPMEDNDFCSYGEI